MSVSSGNTNELKSIVQVYDSEPIVNDEMLKLCLWFHERLFCTYFDAVNAVLPTGISLKMVDFYSPCKNINLNNLSDTEKQVAEFLINTGIAVSINKLVNKFGADVLSVLNNLVKNNIIEKSSEAVRKIGDASQKSVKLLEEDFNNIKLTARQKEIAQLVADFGSVSVKELQYFTGVSASVIDNLVKKGVLEYFENPVYRKPHYTKTGGNNEILLTDQQLNAFNSLKSKLNSQNSALLYGVTGSGKTQVFLKLVDEVVAQNKGVIIMVPEISLTPQTIGLFNNRYQGKIAVFHSAMSLGQRMDEWKRIREGKALIAIGTRSAIFAPFSEIGLIIMDEEQEHTYKSEQSPRYYTRDVARFRSAYHKCLFLMASATPSIESYTAALNNKYSLCVLKDRYGNANLPEVQVVDMREAAKGGNTGVLSAELYNEINNALSQGNQAIVLLNRRGHNTYITCPSCGYVAECPNCSVSLTYHSANNRLMCHYCGYSVPVAQNCPNCNDSHMRFSGIGTQRAYEELSQLFPGANILRLDADSTIRRNSFSEYLTEFANGKYNIMLGTQMVAKGLDFPNVTVVGVIGAEKSTSGVDYRSAERTFSLLTQVVGRAGRGEYKGTAVIQTTDPENNIIELSAKQDYEAFYYQEMCIRKALIYPPFCDIVLLVFQSNNANSALNAANNVLKNVSDLAQNSFSDVKIIALGPAPALMPKINNKYRYTLTIKCRNSKRLRELLRQAINTNLNSDTSIYLDINPEVLF